MFVGLTLWRVQTLEYDLSDKNKTNTAQPAKMLKRNSVVSSLRNPCFVVFGCRESEYAAWTLVNGYALNHVTISVHRLKSHLRSINSLNQFIEENGFKLNSEGGILKGQSPSSIIMQAATVQTIKLFILCQTPFPKNVSSPKMVTQHV